MSNKESNMSEIYSLRLSNEEKEKLQSKAEQYGYHASSDFVRELIKRGFQSFELSQKEEHVLFNSAQSVLLLRELVTLLSGSEEHSLRVINSAQKSAEEWAGQFKQSLQNNTNY